MEARSESVHVGVPDTRGKRISPWAWVPTVNFAQGLQYAIVIQLFIVIFVTMGIPNSVAVFWGSFLGLPWVLKPLWGPIVDRYWSKRNWTIAMQFLVGLSLIGTAIAMQFPSVVPEGESGMPPFLFICIIFLFIMAFASATHDIACDGYYMLALSEKQQAFFVGIRSTAFRVAMITANGILMAMAFFFLAKTGPEPQTITVTTLAPQETAEQVEGANPGADGLDAAEAVAIPDDAIAGIVEEDAPADSPQGEQALEERVAPPEPEDELRLILSETAVASTPDSTTTVTLRITQPPEPGDVVRVTVRIREPGNILKRIFVPEGNKGMAAETEMIQFTAENWHEPRDIVFRIAPKAAAGESVVYNVAAGNVPTSWMLVLLASGLFYFVLVLLHIFAMPRPAADATNVPVGMSAEVAAQRPNILVPIVALGVTIVVPWAIGYGIFQGLHLPENAVRDAIIGPDPTSLQQKGFDFLYRAGAYIVLILVATLVFFIGPLKALASVFFHKMSDISGIGFAHVFTTFFSKAGMFVTLGFLLTFRLGEAQLAQVKNVFLIDTRDNGGIALDLAQLATVNTIVYIGLLTVGGILGGFIIARFGLKNVIWWMVAAMHLPNFLYVYLAIEQPEYAGALNWVNTAVGLEAFGYGFGFTAYLMVMIMTAQGPYKTAHYALCTGFMALGFMIPGMWSGFLQELVGYVWFYWLVILFSIPGMIFIPFLPIDPKFGLRKEADTTPQGAVESEEPKK